jgi:5'-nucleotidase
MKILISNDDGILSLGLKKLIEIFRDGNEIYVVAPDRERSAVSSARMIQGSLYTEEVNLPGTKASFTSSATPADCIKLAVHALKIRPDIVISGINKGQNCGIDIIYSGTVAAAMEGCLLGVPSFAVSLRNKYGTDYDASERYLRGIVDKILTKDEKAETLWNINIPSCRREDVKGIKLNPQADSRYFEEYQGESTGKRKEWNLAKSFIDYGPDDRCDWYHLLQNYISVTPLSINITDKGIINESSKCFDRMFAMEMRG